MILGKNAADALVVWLTGLPAAGKSAIAERVHAYLLGRGLKAERLDGDAVRGLSPELGFSKAERDGHIRRMGYLASVLEKNGVCVVASFVSPYAEARRFARSLCRVFVEVHVSTPLEVCERRDPKGLYAAARRGEKANFTGVHDPYEPPAACELAVDTSELSADEAARRVIGHLEARYLGSPA